MNGQADGVDRQISSRVKRLFSVGLKRSSSNLFCSLASPNESPSVTLLLHQMSIGTGSHWFPRKSGRFQGQWEIHPMNLPMKVLPLDGRQPVIDVLERPARHTKYWVPSACGDAEDCHPAGIYCWVSSGQYPHCSLH